MENSIPTAPASEDGATMPEETPQGQQTPVERSVPIARFKEVVQQRKAAETALSEVVQSMVETVPEAMRDLVPDLPPAQKAAWLRNAQAKGLFAPSAPASSPDSRRPGAKPIENFNSLTAMQKMSMGYRATE
ncbi:hypothetical protein [Desulfovibrio cuneatus]|uniref:hypothetical protein n=1 Tax=Desulfovibrio cuneatus TaxID=159728 RepID=UPI0004054C27|nr:hypothetical protein [Desulfovibrio cuneatus]